MNERYLITEAQIGILKAYALDKELKTIIKVLDGIEDKHFVGNSKKTIENDVIKISKQF